MARKITGGLKEIDIDVVGSINEDEVAEWVVQIGD